MRDRFHWARLLSFVTGIVNQELLLRNEYLAAENHILRAHLPVRLRLSDAERSILAEIAKRLGGKALQEIARVAKPDTLLAWYRQLVAHKFDGSRRRGYPGRPRITPEVERLMVRMARENRGWGQDSGYLNGCRYLLHDRDQKFCREFRETLAAGGVKCLPLPARSPNLRCLGCC